MQSDASGQVEHIGCCMISHVFLLLCIAAALAQAAGALSNLRIEDLGTQLTLRFA